MTFKVIQGQGQGQEMTSVPLGTILLIFWVVTTSVRDLTFINVEVHLPVLRPVVQFRQIFLKSISAGLVSNFAEYLNAMCKFKNPLSNTQINIKNSTEPKNDPWGLHSKYLTMSTAGHL